VEYLTCYGYFDGASRGNPGPACAACAIFDDKNELIWEKSLYLGERTNNEAEYTGLIILLREICKRRLSPVVIHGDSRLVINQVSGAWKVNKPHLMVFLEEIRELTRGLSLSFEWIPRAENSYADSLCNRELDSRQKRKDHFTTFEPSRLEKITGQIYIAHGTEDYAVDLAHGVCTCPAFRKNGNCKHLRAAREMQD